MKSRLHGAFSSRKLRLITLGLITISALVSLAVSASRHQKNTKPQPTLTSEPTITYSTSAPDESKQNADNYTWRGAADEPKKITIPKIGVSAFIQKMGVDQNKQIAVPNNVHLVGWFVDSAKPGSSGLSIIDGHVSGQTTGGIFVHLAKLEKDDTFKVELGSGQVLNYQVLSKVQLKESDAPSQLYSQDPTVSSQLNLITCGGSYDRSSGQFPDRVIVSAKLLNS